MRILGLVQVGKGVADGAGGYDVQKGSVAVKLLKVVDGLLGIAHAEVAKSGVVVGEVAGFGSGIFVSDIQKAHELGVAVQGKAKGVLRKYVLSCVELELCLFFGRLHDELLVAPH